LIIILILGRGQSTLPRPLPLVFGAITATNPYSFWGWKIVLGEGEYIRYGTDNYTFPALFSIHQDGKYNLRIAAVFSPVSHNPWSDEGPKLVLHISKWSVLT